MSSNLVRSWMQLIVVSVTLCLLISSAKIVAEEMEEEKSVAEPLAAMDSGRVADSIYALIQQDFVQLEPIWKKACFDCHSDKTVYPWYYKLPGVKGMIDEDIEEARSEMDMSKGFPFISHRKPVDDLRKLGQEVAEGAMPPGKYKLMHWSASLSSGEKESVASFVENSLKMLAAHGIVPTQRQKRVEGN